jgi:type I restriction enzyme R subunit
MESQNFEYIRAEFEELADYGALAELYAYPDPASCLVKLRTIVEEVVKAMYLDDGLSRPYQWGLNELLNDHAFAGNVSAVILDKMHLVRKQGNRAAHGNPIQARDALDALEATFDVVRWFYIIYLDGSREDVSAYQPPPQTRGLVSETESRRERDRLMRHMAAKEQELEDALASLEKVRKSQEIVTKDKERLEAQLARGQQLAKEWNFDEAQTRKHLIDLQLREAGWDVHDSDQVGLEVLVKEQPTDSGDGFVDYVLWGDNGAPLAIIEAKRFSINPSNGRKQAQLYADWLEKKYERRPIIYCSNGAKTEIWNDGQGEPARQIMGFYSKDSLVYLHFQAREKQHLEHIELDGQIAGRLYQVEAQKRILERLQNKHRSALLVLATGTGKTRTAISLSKALIDARWAKRILFLCDRRELRKQAFNAFKEHLPTTPGVIVKADTATDRDKRLYFATYPAMSKYYQSFDIGFFDVIIADESHRSVYNVYKTIFDYFDAIRIGLTATPVQFINRNTYRLFGCENKNPTAHYSYEDAISSTPPSLVPFRVVSHTTKFLRDGIKYSQMTEVQRQQLEDGEELPELVEFEAREVDTRVFNKDTNRRVLRNLMEHGIRDATGQQVGKTIIFARNHVHAVLLEELFNELYPQYGGAFCQVIDYHNARAEQLIEDFKGTGTNKNLMIAISVDMLDTGIDVPELVNLVFAKPVRSNVKFWQMIGRGTRLCEDLFGPGKDKTEFLIFDHWKNFEFFEQNYEEVEPPQRKSLMERLFGARVQLASVSKSQYERAFVKATELILADLRSLPEESVEVRPHTMAIKQFTEDETALDALDERMQHILEGDLAALMQWRPVDGQADAYLFDLLIARLQVEVLRRSSKVEDYKNQLEEVLGELPGNLSQVKAKQSVIDGLLNLDFWTQDDCVEIVLGLEEARTKLRGLMKYRQRKKAAQVGAMILDIDEDSEAEERQDVEVRINGLELTAYRRRVYDVLAPLFETSAALRKIRQGQAISEQELDELQAMVLEQDPSLDLGVLRAFYPEFANNLGQVLQSIVGLDAKVVNEVFAEFVHSHPGLQARQVKFLEMLKNHIGKYGSLQLDQLYEAPFTRLAPEGIEGVFDDDTIDELRDLLDIISISVH